MTFDLLPRGSIMAVAPASGMATKSVLVCFGERKRPVTLPNDSSVNDLKLAIVNEYQDVLPRSSSSTDQSVADRLVLQIKSEDWDGVFVDLKDAAEVPDRSVLRVVEECQKVIVPVGYTSGFVDTW